MDRITTIKEAIKTSLALVMVYYLGMRLGWMNPYWAAWAVAMIALPTAGQSIQKGILRLAGTVPGCIAGVVILGMASHNRWAFILVTCTWIFFTTYMMLVDKKNSYFWNVAGFVCLIIVLTGPGSSKSLFEHAVFRTVETGMGVIVYTLVSVFLWPRTNAGTLVKTAGSLLDTQIKHYGILRDASIARVPSKTIFEAANTSEVQQLGQLAQALQAEGSESYQVQEYREQWERFHGLSTALMNTFDKWQADLDDIHETCPVVVFPALPAFFEELDARLAYIQVLFTGSSASHEVTLIELKAESEAVETLSHMQRAALAVVRKNLENLDGLTRAMLGCAASLFNAEAMPDESPMGPAEIKGTQWMHGLVPDRDHLRGAGFAALAVFIGFLVWIFFNPPGHAGWFQFSGSLAMAVAGTQQLRASVFVKPVGVASVLALAVYVLVMPMLSRFSELGLLIFLMMFINCTMFKGLAQLAGTIAILNEISVQNQQVYSFAGMANAYIFTLAGFLFIFGLSYMLRTPRPEKALLYLTRRFFNSAAFLISQLAPAERPGLLKRWQLAFYSKELETLPAKVGAWGHAVNPGLFPANPPDKVQPLTAAMQAMVYRIESLKEVGDVQQVDSIAGDIHTQARKWQSSVENVFRHWALKPDVVNAGELKKRLTTWFQDLERRIDAVLESKTIHENGVERFYRVLGGCRGVSAAMLAYACAADDIDWSHWREEKFS